MVFGVVVCGAIVDVVEVAAVVDADSVIVEGEFVEFTFSILSILPNLGAPDGSAENFPPPPPLFTFIVVALPPGVV